MMRSLRSLRSSIYLTMLCCALSSNPTGTPCAQSQAVTHTGRKPTSADPYLDVVVATAGSHKITRRDVAVLYRNYFPDWDAPDPRTASDPEMSSAGNSDLARLAPHIFNHKPPHNGVPVNQNPGSHQTADLDRLAHRIFTHKDPGVPPLVEKMVRVAAMDQVARERKVPVTDAEVASAVHRMLEFQREQNSLPEMPDDRIAAQIHSNYTLLLLWVRDRLLVHNLTLSDLNDRLGHPPTPQDFYSLHLVVVSIDPLKARVKGHAKSMEDARAQAEALRSEIVSKQRTFEEVARKESDDPSASHDGNFGPVVKTLIAATLDQAIQTLRPGEITPVVPIRKGYAFARLDRLGPDLTPRERQQALELCAMSERRNRHALARVMQSVKCTTTLGTVPKWLDVTE